MKNKYLGLICLLYAGIIGYVWFFNKLKYFLAPQMQLYIKIAFFPLIIIGLVMLFSKGKNKFKISDLVLILPLVMLIICMDGRLTLSLANNRMNVKNLEGKQKVTLIEEKEEIDLNSIEYDFSNVDFDVKDQTYDDLSNYITFIPGAKVYKGKTIRLRGFTTMHASYIPEGYFAIGKYVISCCVADATYSAFIVKLDNQNVKHNHWYEIEGVLFPSVDGQGYEIMAIKIVNIKEIDGNNEEQYVYPCYAYDNGECAETQKYNLNYDY